MNSVAADVRYALRLFHRSPGFAAIAIGTLALGIGANSVIFSGVEAFLLRPLPVPDSERIVFLRAHSRNTGARLALSYPDLMDWRSGAPALQHIAAIQIDTFNLSGDGEAERVRGSRVTADFFSVFAIPPLAGRIFNVNDDRPGAHPVLIVSESLAQRRFGGPAALGRTLNVDGCTYTVAGIMPRQMSFPMGFAELWLPLATDAVRSPRHQHYLAAVAKLRPGASIEEARRQVDAVARQLERTYPDTNKDLGVWMTSLAEQISSGPRQAILVLWTAVAFVLLICCANLANLMLARAVHRSREFAIRQAVGASRWQLLRQVLIESALLSVAGGAVGLLVAGWGIDLLSASVPALMLPMGGLSLNVRVLLFTMALALATGIVFGLLPAIRTLRSQAAESLREGGRAMAGGRSRNRIASALVVGEVTLAVTLLGGAGLLLTALMRMQNTEMGFDPRQVLTAEIAAKGEKYTQPVRTVLVIEDILRRLNTSSDVVGAAAVNLPPMTNTISQAFSVDGKPAITQGRPPMADYVVATAAYAQVMRIPVLRGRFISDEDRRNSPLIAVVNQRFAEREWPGQDPLGREVSLYVGAGQLGPPRTVVGVVGNVRHGGPAADPNPAIYLPFAQDPQTSLYLTVRAKSSPARFAPALQSVVKNVDADLPLALVRPMERLMADAMAPARFTTGLLAIFSAAALLLASIGLYGVIAYLVARRTHEFGVRIAMGATPRKLLALVLRRSLALTCTGTALGLAAASAVSRVLAAVMRGVRPDGGVFALVAATLTVVAILAAYVPLRRALASGPLDALRSE